MKITFQQIESLDQEAALETVTQLVEYRGILRARVRFERLAPIDIDETEEEIAKLGYLIQAARFRAKRIAQIKGSTADVSEETLRTRLAAARKQIEYLREQNRRLGNELHEAKQRAAIARKTVFQKQKLESELQKAKESLEEAKKTIAFQAKKLAGIF